MVSLAQAFGKAALLFCLGFAVLVHAAPAQPRGLPFIRTYPLDEIGSIPRGSRLGIDAFGRVAVMYDGVYSVLNDTAWVNRIPPQPRSNVQMTTIRVIDGHYYYGGRGSWGRVELTPDGLFRAVPLVPPEPPAWTAVTPFNWVLGTSQGVYFYEMNGVVYWDISRGKNVYFPMPRVSAAFLRGDQLLVSCQDGSLRELHPADGTESLLTVPGLTGELVQYAAALDGDRTLLALRGGRLVVFDGKEATPWAGQAENGISGKITAMQPLIEGGVSLSVQGEGLYLLSESGVLRWALKLPELRRVSDLVAGEPGVLWVMGENALHRVFYESPLTGFGQQLGLTAVWPDVAQWDHGYVICSNHSLFAVDAGRPGYPAVCREVEEPSRRVTDRVAASGPHLLAGNEREVFTVTPRGAATRILKIENVAGMVFLQPDVCVVIGSREIAAVKFENGAWSECAPRIPGVGDSPIVVQKFGAIWVELGGSHVARLTLGDGVLRLQPVPVPWSGAQWTNVGALGGTIILSGAPGQRCYYDEKTERIVENPRIDAILRRSPYWILRVGEDASGIWWATHAHGAVTFSPRGDDYVLDSSSYELRNDSYPRVLVFPGNDAWFAAGRSVYHVEREGRRNYKAAGAMLVSVFADQKQREFLQGTDTAGIPRQFSFEDNSLSFRFFSGTYAWRSPPLYEYRLSASDAWTPVDPTLVLRFPKLRDGAYRLEVRPAGPREPAETPFTFAFAIRAPWYRTPAAFFAWTLALLAILVGIARWMNARSLQRNAALEQLVQERTQELENAMDRLGEETEAAATLAERSRLAGEIHDSLQQGLSGAILHLNTTLANQPLSRETLAQLTVVKNMLSYSREEVQQAVWNLASPLLHDTTLGEALKKLVGFIHAGGATIDISVEGEDAALDSRTRHNLLRIAQEAITNAVKHSKASRIEVALRTDEHAVALTVRDDGCGFDLASPAPRTGHLGLRGMQSRAKAIRARIEIRSAAGKGTTVHVTLSPSPPASPNSAIRHEPL